MQKYYHELRSLCLLIAPGHEVDAVVRRGGGHQVGGEEPRQGHHQVPLAADPVRQPAQAQRAEQEAWTQSGHGGQERGSSGYPA